MFEAGPPSRAEFPVPTPGVESCSHCSVTYRTGVEHTGCSAWSQSSAGFVRGGTGGTSTGTRPRRHVSVRSLLFRPFALVRVGFAACTRRREMNGQLTQPRQAAVDSTKVAAVLGMAVDSDSATQTADGPILVEERRHEPYRVPAPLQIRDPERYEVLGEFGRGGLGRVCGARTTQRAGAARRDQGDLSRGALARAPVRARGADDRAPPASGIVPVYEPAAGPTAAVLRDEAGRGRT